MHTDALFWFSVVMSAGSLLLMAIQIIAHLRPAPAPAPGGLGDVKTQSLDVKEIIEQVGKTAGAFQKAGPIASCAVLCLFFGVLAAAASGVVKLSAG